MTGKASEANELLCDNNTKVSSFQSVSFFLRKLGFLDKIFSKKSILFISNKVYKDLIANKASLISQMTIKASDRQTRTRYCVTATLQRLIMSIGQIFF